MLAKKSAFCGICLYIKDLIYKHIHAGLSISGINKMLNSRPTLYYINIVVITIKSKNIFLISYFLASVFNKNTEAKKHDIKKTYMESRMMRKYHLRFGNEQLSLRWLFSFMKLW